MKKITAFALLVALATSASAATIKWGASGQTYYGDTKLTGSASTAYLVYLGEKQSDWSSFDYATDFEGTRLASKAMSSLGGAGANNQFKVVDGEALGGIDSVSAIFTDKVSSFGVLFTTTQGNKDYYYLGDVFTFDTTSSSYNGTTSTFTATSTAAPGKTATWTQAAVPEPGTAALALLGIGMLIRRRRA